MIVPGSDRPPTRLRRNTLLLMAGGLFACESGERGPSAHMVEDSAGVEIVTSHGPAWEPGQEWRLGTEPRLVLGAATGRPELLFSRLGGAVRLDDGRIVVGDGGSNELRFFDREGGFLQAVGGEGEGPGEFAHLRALRRCRPDSLFAFDIGWELEVFDTAGRHVRSAIIETPEAEPSPYELSCNARGQFLLSGWGWEAVERRTGYYRTKSPLWLAGPEGGLVRRLGVYPGAERIGERGGREQRLAAVDEGRRPAVRRRLAELEAVGTLPPFDRFLLDSEGNLWVRDFLSPTGERERWAVFDPAGVLLGMVGMPAGFSVTEVGAGYVLGIATDDLEVERVALYELIRTP